LDPSQHKLIEAYVDDLRELENPLVRAKRLSGDWAGCWRFEVGKYRHICEVFDEVLLIEMFKVAKRDRVYD
jgi:mRNA-degrading endonuclease RelE of RelBE toxin-antitoxin system